LRLKMGPRATLPGAAAQMHVAARLSDVSMK
jgi:hypothetical protein